MYQQYKYDQYEYEYHTVPGDSYLVSSCRAAQHIPRWEVGVGHNGESLNMDHSGCRVLRVPWYFHSKPTFVDCKRLPLKIAKFFILPNYKMHPYFSSGNIKIVAQVVPLRPHFFFYNSHILLNWLLNMHVIFAIGR